MKNKVVLFDIDHTMFNTDLYLEKAFMCIAGKINGFSKEEILTIAKKTYMHMREIDVFHPRKFAEDLNAYLGGKTDIEKIIDCLENQELLTSCIYSDVYISLQNLAQVSGITLGIFSSGDAKLQIAKINSLQRFFAQNDIHIYPLKDIQISQVLNQYHGQKMYIVDDLLRILHEVKNISVTTTVIWMKRIDPDYHDGEVENFVPDKQIATLSEVISII